MSDVDAAVVGTQVQGGRTAVDVADEVYNALVQTLQQELSQLRSGLGQEIVNLEGRQNSKMSELMAQVNQKLGVTGDAAAAATSTANAAGTEALRAGRVAQDAGDLASRVGATAATTPSPISTMRFAPIKPPPPPRFRGSNDGPKILEWLHCAQS